MEMIEMTGGGMPMVPAVPQTNALATVDQSRAIAEVQASLVIAKSNPRNEQYAEHKILNACKRKSLAECASYTFKRGGTLVTGSSIRLAETLARYWGNINYGFREIGRGKDYSEVEAFAHDLETNVRVNRVFQVKHWRDSKGGGSALTQERDKYEMIASQAQRRVRACLLELIPGDIVEMAEDACRATLEQSIGDIEKKKKDIIGAFAQFKISQEDIEDYLQRSMDSMVPADVVSLQRIYRSIKDGIASPKEFFKKDEKADQVAELNKRFASQSGNQQAGKQEPKQEQTMPAEEATPPAEPQNEPVENMETTPRTVSLPPKKKVIRPKPAAVKAMMEKMEGLTWQTLNSYIFDATSPIAMEFEHEGDQGKLKAYAYLLLHMKQVEQCETDADVNELADLKLPGFKGQIKKFDPEKVEEYFKTLQDYAVSRLTELRGGSLNPNHDADAKPEDEYSDQLNKLLEGLNVQGSSTRIDKFCYARQQVIEKLSEEEREIFHSRVSEHREFVNSVDQDSE